MARSRWCSAMRARSARCFTHWLQVRSRTPHSTRPCYASHARRSASHFSSHYACARCCAVRTVAAQAWRAPRTSSSRYLWMARCAAALRATFAWLGSPYPSPFPSAGRSGLLCACWSDLWSRSWQGGRRRWPPARSARSRASRAPRRVAAGPAGPRTTGAHAPSSLRLCGVGRPALSRRASSTRLRTHARRPSRLGDIVCAVCDVRPRAIA